MPSVVLLKNALGQKAGDRLDDLTDEDVEMLGDKVAVLEEEVAEDEDADDGLEKEPVEESLKKSLHKKADQIEEAVAKALRKKAEKAARPDPGAGATARVIRDEIVHKSFGHYLQDQVAWNRDHDTTALKRLMSYPIKKAIGNTTGTNPEVIPEYWAQQLWEKPYFGVDFVAMATPYPMENQKTLHIPSNNKSSDTTGIVAYSAAEAGTMTVSSFAGSECVLTANEYYMVAGFTDQFIKFSPYGVQQVIMTQGRYALKRKQNYDFFYGTGTNQFQGLNNAPALLTLARPHGDAVGSFTYFDLLNMKSRAWIDWGDVANEYMFVANPEDDVKIRQIEDTNGNFIFLPNQTSEGLVAYPNVANRPAGKALGINIVYSDVVTVGDLWLVCPKAVAYGHSGEFSDESIHVNYLTNERLVRLVKYQDCRLIPQAGFVNKGSGNTMSPVIKLGAVASA